MYLRTTQRKNKNGTTVRYVQLAHNRRVNGTTQAEVVHNFGREDHLDTDGLRRLVASINRYLGEDGADAAAPAAAGGLEVTGSRPLGAVWLLQGMWRQLEIDQALKKILGARRFRTDVERVLFALVANRAIAPASKLSAAEWAGRDAVIPGLETMDEDQAYRAMDLLVEADARAEVQEAVFFAVANLLNFEVDLLYFDTTNTYFERDEPDAGEAPFRAYGKSKDHRDDLPQITIGLAVTKEGVPVRCWVWPGGTSDQAILPQVRDDMRDWKLGRVITVVDRGFSSADNLAYLTRAGGHYIAGMRMRDGSDLAEAALARQGRYQMVRDNLRVKEVKLDQAPGRRFVICHNPAQEERDRHHREEAIKRVEAELERIRAQRERDAKRAATPKARERAEAAHVRAECALIEHPTLKRWLRSSKNGRLAIDRAKVKAEERLDGKYLLTSSDPHLSAEEIAVGYKALLEAERGFRDLKTVLELRPVFHRLEHRIRAHVLLCWLALLLIRVAERRTGQTWNRISTQLGRVHEVTLTGDAGQITQTTPLTSQQATLYRDCGIKPPPRITAADPA